VLRGKFSAKHRHRKQTPIVMRKFNSMLIKDLIKNRHFNDIKKKKNAI